jgi:hypothetical protein
MVDVWIAHAGGPGFGQGLRAYINLSKSADFGIRHLTIKIPRKKILIIYTLWELAAVAALVLLYFIDPAKPGGPFPPCLFHALTGLHCPGCGTTRALHQLLHGNIRAALGLNLLMVASLPFLAYAFVSKGLVLFGRRLPVVFSHPAWTWALFALVILFWILRNIPAYPFSLLAPR